MLGTPRRAAGVDARFQVWRGRGESALNVDDRLWRHLVKGMKPEQEGMLLLVHLNLKRGHFSLYLTKVCGSFLLTSVTVPPSLCDFLSGPCCPWLVFLTLQVHEFKEILCGPHGVVWA